MNCQHSEVVRVFLAGDDSSQVFAGTRKRVTNSRKYCFAHEVLIRGKKGIGDGLEPLPPEQEGGKEKNKSFPLKGHS